MKVLIFRYLYIRITDDGSLKALYISLLMQINEIFVSALLLLFFIISKHMQILYFQFHKNRTMNVI